MSICRTLSLIFLLAVVLGNAAVCNVRSGACKPSTTTATNASRKLGAIETRYVVSESYFKNGQFSPLYTGRTFPITVDTEKVRDGLINVNLRAINTFKFEISYNNADGWVNTVKVGDRTFNGGDAADLAAELKVRDIIGNANQIAFENNGRIQFIADNGSSRVSFDKYYPRRLAAIESRSVAASTYQKNGSLQPLYTGRTFPITVETEVPYGGLIKVTLRGINTFKFDIEYNNADGWVKKVNVGDRTFNGGDAADLAAELKVRDIIGNANQIAFENDGRIQFIADNGTSRISFDRSGSSPPQQTSGQYRVVKETYTKDGSLQPLFTGAEFPVTMDTSRPHDGKILVTLYATNTMNFDISYNNADGWVNSVSLTGETRRMGSSDQMATDAKLKDLINNCNQIAFEKDGKIQFIANNGSSRVTFEPTNQPRRLAAVETRSVAASTYMKNGSFQALYTGRTFPITVETEVPYGGLIKVTLRGINTFKFDIEYNNADGWVKKVNVGDRTFNGGDAADLAAELKVRDIIGNANQIAFENDGRIQFIADNGSTRVSFDRSGSYPTPPPQQTSGQYRVVKETYTKDGSFQPLFTGAEFPVTMDTSRPHDGKILVTLYATNTMNFEITYNNADGWVNNVYPTGETRRMGSSDQMATDAKLKDLINRCNQIAFERDGKIQFIANNGSSRVTFEPTIQRRLAGVETRNVMAQTYQKNGSFQPLFTGRTFPITVQSETFYPGTMKVTLRGINTFNFDISYNNADGWVNTVKVGDRTFNGGDAADLAAELKVRDIIANANQIAFESNRVIQFIADNGSSRVSFN